MTHLKDTLWQRYNGKSFGRSVNLICYFTDELTGANFTISVFKDTGTYAPVDGSIDFSLTGIVGNKYYLKISKKDGYKFPTLVAARKLLEDISKDEFLELCESLTHEIEEERSKRSSVMLSNEVRWSTGLTSKLVTL